MLTATGMVVVGLALVLMPREWQDLGVVAAMLGGAATTAWMVLS